MPPRYAYWTIIAGGLPTAFRTTERDELLPTFRRIKEKHPDAELKYFARGKLWASPEEARLAAEARRTASRHRHTSTGDAARGRNWRPGGEHRDPRQKFKDAKKAGNLARRQRRFNRREHGAPEGHIAERGKTRGEDADRQNENSRRPADFNKARPGARARHRRRS
jgi:hypothetical protein